MRVAKLTVALQSSAFTMHFIVEHRTQRSFRLVRAVFICITDVQLTLWIAVARRCKTNYATMQLCNYGLAPRATQEASAYGVGNINSDFSRISAHGVGKVGAFIVIGLLS